MYEVTHLDMQRTIRIRLHPNKETAQVLERTISDYTWAFKCDSFPLNPNRRTGSAMGVTSQR